MIKVVRGDEARLLLDDIQLAAFMAQGWVRASDDNTRGKRKQRQQKMPDEPLHEVEEANGDDE